MRKILLIAFVLVLVSGTYLVLNSKPKTLSQEQRKEALEKLTGQNPTLSNSNSKKGDVEHKGKYISFMYPASASIYNLAVNGQKVEDNAALDYFAFDTKAPNMSAFTEVIEAPSTVLKIEDYPGVRLRQNDNSYTQSLVSISGVNGLSFIKDQPGQAEESAFFYYNSKIYTISITGSDLKSIKDLFDKVVTTAKFL